MHKLECDGQTDTQNHYINFAPHANVKNGFRYTDVLNKTNQAVSIQQEYDITKVNYLTQEMELLKLKKNRNIFTTTKNTRSPE